jgi:hypothetical protein
MQRNFRRVQARKAENMRKEMMKGDVGVED